MAKFQVNRWTLVKGSTNHIMVILLDEAFVPYNISGLTALSCKIKRSDNTYLSLNQSQGIAWGTVNPCWAYVFELTVEQIEAIGTGVHDVGIEVEVGTKNTLLFYKDSLTIAEPLMDIY